MANITLKCSSNIAHFIVILPFPSLREQRVVYQKVFAYWRSL